MAFTKKQARSLAKAWRARGMRVPAKIRHKLKNPGTRAGAKKGWRKRTAKNMKRRRKTAKRVRRRLKGYKVTARRRAGRRRKNRKIGRRLRMKTGRKGTVSISRKRRVIATNPRRRRSYRRNPAKAMSVKGWTGGLTGLPKNVQGLLKGKVLNNALYATGGMIGSMMVGGLTRGAIMGMIGKVAPTLATNRIAQGALGAAVTYTGGYVVGTMLIKNPKARTAFITGSAIAAVVNAIMPGQINALLTKIPVVGPKLSLLPGMNGLGAYVSAPSYQGVGAYVDAPAYQGVGMLPTDAVAGIGYDDALAGGLGTYVDAPGYQGVGMWGASHLDQ